ncbi:MAG TPA: ABC transporter substrate-binding protein [Gaiellaceae bacterium]|nr:ABC transporter substrate-binding protein [Gaiellaceae bacterium]
MSGRTRRGRFGRVSRRTVLAAALVAAAVALVVPASGFGNQVTSTQACQLSVFSWWTGPGESDGLARLINMWNKAHPDCKVKNEAVAGGAGSNAKAVLAQRLAAGNPPDTFQWHAGAELTDHIKAKQIVPVDFIYKQFGFAKVMPASLISQIRYQGKLWSVPVNIHRANVLWFNPKTLRQAGIKPPNMNTSYSWAQFMAALQKAQDAGLVPLSMGEQWTAVHLLETVMIGTLGPRGYAALFTPNSAKRWQSAKVTTALNRYNTLLGYTNSDAASLSWQDAGKLVADGKAAFNVMGDWQNGLFSGSKSGGNFGLKPLRDYGWTAVPGTSGIYDWLSDGFTLPKGAPHQAEAVEWLGLVGSRAAQNAFNPLKGSIPARKDANPKLYGTYLKWALTQWKTDRLAGSLAHGVVASLPWMTDVGTATGLYLQNKNVARFQTALVAAARKHS